MNIFVIWIADRFSILSVYLYRSYNSVYNFRPASWNSLSFFDAKAEITRTRYLNIAFYVFIAFLYYFYYNVGYAFYSTYYFPPFFACFLSSFFGGGALPPFLFLSYITSSSLLNILIDSDTSLSSLGYVFSLIISN